MVWYRCHAEELGLLVCRNSRKSRWGVCRQCWAERIVPAKLESQYFEWWQEAYMEVNKEDGEEDGEKCRKSKRRKY